MTTHSSCQSHKWARIQGSIFLIRQYPEYRQKMVGGLCYGLNVYILPKYVCCNPNTLHVDMCGREGY